jgi:plastocyanin
MENHAGGIAITAFVVALAVSMGYYQFIYIPQASAKPILPEEVLEPVSTTKVTIIEGASLESNPRFFDPKEIRAPMGLANLVVWTSKDTVPHTVTSDDGYRDAYSGLFDSRERPAAEGGPFVMPGESFEFLFTKVGEYAYHCEPHPWMKGTIEVVENFS